jgi:hypothetical protein
MTFSGPQSVWIGKKTTSLEIFHNIGGISQLTYCDGCLCLNLMIPPGCFLIQKDMYQAAFWQP